MSEPSETSQSPRVHPSFDDAYIGVPTDEFWRERLTQLWVIQTVSGSVYWISRDGHGRWWIAGTNVATPRSCSLADGCWEVQRPVPWPPTVGLPLIALAPEHLAFDDPARMPGGGKLTSIVAQARPLPASRGCVGAGFDPEP